MAAAENQRPGPVEGIEQGHALAARRGRQERQAYQQGEEGDQRKGSLVIRVTASTLEHAQNLEKESLVS